MFAGCAEDRSPGGGSDPGSARPPGGVGDKPIVATPLGPAVADELVMRLAAGPVDAAADELAAEVGGSITWRAPRSGAYLVQFADAATTSQALDRLGHDPAVSEVRRNLITHGSGFGSSPGRTQWNLYAVGLNASSTWGSAAGITVAVLDTGVAYEVYADPLGDYAVAPDLAGVTFSGAYDFVNDDAHANDDQGHGTHVTGILASTGDLLAVARGAEIQPIKVLGADNLGTELGLAEGLLLAAESDADVINLSLSFSPAFFPSRFLQDAVDEASASGAIMVAAVGNHARDVVTYPAAFRDVIAVAASRLDSSFRPNNGEQPWKKALTGLERADYSNRGYLIDVTAPGGMIDQDLNGDGNPEAILAQSFVSDPTEFEYLFYAGTSQAAAQVSGIAAVMLAGNPDLERSDLRAVLGETARRVEDGPLSAALGRGFMDASSALAHSHGQPASRDRPRFSTAIRLSLHDTAEGRIARAVVDVVDGEGNPADGVVVYGTFTGGVNQSGTATTSSAGRVVFRTGALADPRVIGFQVDAVAASRFSGDHGHGKDFSHWKTTVDRPGGFVRIDSCSLDLLSDFADLVGSGFGSSPGSPLSLALPQLAPDEVATVSLVNFSWSGASPAMAVVADRSWFDATYPDAHEVRVTGLAGGRTDTTLRFTAAESFPLPLDDVGDECVDLVVGTFGSGFGSSPGRTPIFPDPDGSCQESTQCDAYRLLFEQLWANMAPEDGGTVPTFDQGSGVSQASYDQLVGMMTSWIPFAADPMGSPVVEYSDALEAAGIGATPYDDEPATDLGAGSAVYQ